MSTIKTMSLTVLALLGGSTLAWAALAEVDELSLPHSVSRESVSQAVEEDVLSVTQSDPATGSLSLPQAVTTHASMREVIHSTRSAGTERVPELRRAALNSDDCIVVGNALQALARLGAFARDAELLRLIEDPRLRVRQEAIRAAGISGHSSAVEPLERALAGGAPIRPLVIEALGRIGGRPSAEILEAVLADTNSSRTDLAFARAAMRRRAD